MAEGVLDIMKRIIIGAVAALSLCLSCNPAEALCQKQYDCQEELGLALDDDFPAVCAAKLEGENNALRKNAEKQCDDFANAQVGLAVCESALGCEELKKAREDPEGDGDLCAEPRQSLATAFEGTNNGADCDGIADEPAGEGEGEGEGE